MDDPLALQSIELSQTLFLVFISIILVFLNGFFVAAEFAIVKVRRTRLEELERQGNPLATKALECVNHLDEYLSATQLGITIVSLALGWIGEESFHSLFLQIMPQNWVEHSTQIRVASTAASFLTITLLHVVLGELVPKSMAIQRSEKISLLIAPPMILFYKFSRPLIHTFTSIANWILRRLGYHQAEEEAFTEEELKIVVEDSEEEGVLSESEANIIRRAFSFSDKRARDIMVAADQVHFLSLARTAEENEKFLARNKHTRFPLCLTDFSNVIGIVNMKDFFLFDRFDSASLKRVARSAPVVYADTKQDQILKFFTQNKTQMAIVRDQRTKKNIGIVTAADVIEELVGEIKDEYS